MQKKHSSCPYIHACPCPYSASIHFSSLYSPSPSPSLFPSQQLIQQFEQQLTNKINEERKLFMQNFLNNNNNGKEMQVQGDIAENIKIQGDQEKEDTSDIEVIIKENKLLKQENARLNAAIQGIRRDFIAVLQDKQIIIQELMKIVSRQRSSQRSLQSYTGGSPLKPSLLPLRLPAPLYTQRASTNINQHVNRIKRDTIQKYQYDMGETTNRNNGSANYRYNVKVNPTSDNNNKKGQRKGKGVVCLRSNIPSKQKHKQIEIEISQYRNDSNQIQQMEYKNEDKQENGPQQHKQQQEKNKPKAKLIKNI